MPVVRVRLAGVDSDQDEFLQDVSTGGVYLRSQRSLPVGSSLELELLRPDVEPLTLRAEVLRLDVPSRGVPGMALGFRSVPESVQEDLERWLSDQARDDGGELGTESEVQDYLQVLRGRLDAAAGAAGAVREPTHDPMRLPAESVLAMETSRVREELEATRRQVQRERQLRASIESQLDRARQQLRDLEELRLDSLETGAEVEELRQRLARMHQLVQDATAVARQALSRLEQVTVQPSAEAAAKASPSAGVVEALVDSPGAPVAPVGSVGAVGSVGSEQGVQRAGIGSFDHPETLADREPTIVPLSPESEDGVPVQSSSEAAEDDVSADQAAVATENAAEDDESGQKSATGEAIIGEMVGEPVVDASAVDVPDENFSGGEQFDRDEIAAREPTIPFHRVSHDQIEGDEGDELAAEADHGSEGGAVEPSGDVADDAEVAEVADAAEQDREATPEEPPDEAPATGPRSIDRPSTEISSGTAPAEAVAVSPPVDEALSADGPPVDASFAEASNDGVVHEEPMADGPGGGVGEEFELDVADLETEVAEEPVAGPVEEAIGLAGPPIEAVAAPVSEPGDGDSPGFVPLAAEAIEAARRGEGESYSSTESAKKTVSFEWQDESTPEDGAAATGPAFRSEQPTRPLRLDELPTSLSEERDPDPSGVEATSDAPDAPATGSEGPHAEPREPDAERARQPFEVFREEPENPAEPANERDEPREVAPPVRAQAHQKERGDAAVLGPDEVSTRTEFVEHLEAGSELVKTDRFRHLEPVSRGDIQVSDWLAGAGTYAEVIDASGGRMPSEELQRILHIFFERGLVRLRPRSLP